MTATNPVWTYEQISGRLTDPEGVVVGFGYSGAGVGKNNPDMQDVAFVGPIPVGFYLIGDPYDSTDHGPFVLPLTPDPTNQMFGRDAFLIHGDKKNQPGTASEGCIILARNVREDIHASLYKLLEVVRG